MELSIAIALWIVYLAGLAQDEAGRAAYVDHDRDGLIALASTAVESGVSASFLQAKLSTAAAVPFAAAVDSQLTSLRQRGIAGHLRTLGA